MLKIVFIVIYFLSISNVFAQESNQDIKKLSDILKQFIMATVSPKFPTCSEEVVIQIEENYNQCLKSICQTEESFENYREYLSRFIDLKSIDAVKVPEDFKLRFIQHIDKFIEKEKAEIIDLQKALSLADFSINPKFKELHHVAFLLSFNEYLEFDFSGEEIIVKGFKESTPEKPIPHFSPEEKEWVVKATKESNLFKDLLSLHSDPELFLLKRLPNLSISDAVKKQAAITRAEFNKLKKEMKILEKVIDLELVDQVLNGKELTTKELPHFLMAVYMTEKILPLVLTPNEYPILHNGIEINLKDMLERRNVAKNIEEYKTKINNHDYIKQKKDDVVLDCYINYLMKELSPSPNDKTNFLANLVNYKSEFKDGISKVYSAHSAQKLHKLIDQLSFKLPDSQDEYVGNFKFETEKVFKDMTEDSKEHRALVGDEKSLLQLKMYDFMIPLEEEIFDEIKRACRSNDVSPEINDRTQTLVGKIMVSWQSLRLPLGKGVIFHEIGHNVFSSFQKDSLSTESKKSFNKTISCLNQLHPDKQISGEEVALYTDEDYSDLLSAYFNTSKETQSFACHFVDQRNLGDLTRYVHNPLINEDELDPHSSPFFRLLHYEFVSKGKLPLVCESYLQKSQEKFPIKNCLK